MTTSMRSYSEHDVPPLCGFLASGGLILVVLLVMLGPGPKYEEGFLVAAFGALLVPLAVVSAAVSPRPHFTAVVFPLLWCLGCLATWIQVAVKYGYPFANWRLLGIVLLVAACGGIGLIIINWAAGVIRRWLSAWHHAT